MRLSDFKDEKALEVIADLIDPIAEIVSSPENKAASKQTPLKFVQAVMRNTPKSVMHMMAILNDEKPENYHCTSASVLKNALEMFTAPDIMALFGLQSETPASSGSALATTEAPETSAVSSDT